jgi:hypothetical protein
MVVQPDEYLSEDAVLARWQMLTAKELKRARKSATIAFYAFRTGPHYTAEQIQAYIDGTYLRRLAAENGETTPLFPNAAPSSTDDQPKIPPDILLGAAELLGERIGRRPKRRPLRPPSENNSS